VRNFAEAVELFKLSFTLGNGTQQRVSRSPRFKHMHMRHNYVSVTSNAKGTFVCARHSLLIHNMSSMITCWVRGTRT